MQKLINFVESNKFEAMVIIFLVILVYLSVASEVRLWPFDNKPAVAEAEETTTVPDTAKIDSTAKIIPVSGIITLKPVDELCSVAKGWMLCSSDTTVVKIDSLGRFSALAIGETKLCANTEVNELRLEVPRNFGYSLTPRPVEENKNCFNLRISAR